ncbi:MAG: CoA transferase [Alphaproteobacteria bacterium]|nr:CoA transferase [Alphaproteobacteria bacterium]
MAEQHNQRPNLPLAGVRVIDFGQIYQGPYATLLMAKAGADVVKVEPIGGEPMRNRAKTSRGAGIPLAMLNSNKRAITLNLKTERGRDLLKSLVRQADVLLENFTPDVMTKLGVGWEVLREINPRLIYASGSGYGLSGPDRDAMAMDLTVQAKSGIMSVTGMPDGPPLKCGAAVVDFMSGIHLYAAVMTALYERTFTGQGRLVEVSMQEAVFPALASNLGMMYSQDGAVPPRTANRHGGLSVAPYNVYAAKDGHIAINAVKEVHWQGLLKIMGREDLLGEDRFSSNKARVEHMAETDALIEAWSRTKTRAEIMALAEQQRLPVAPVRNLVEVANDPHMHQRGMLEWIDHPVYGRIVVPTSPLRIHGADKVETVPSPEAGQHNSEVLADWLGLKTDEVARLAADGII